MAVGVSWPAEQLGIHWNRPGQRRGEDTWGSWEQQLGLRAAPPTSLLETQAFTDEMIRCRKCKIHFVSEFHSYISPMLLCA